MTSNCKKFKCNEYRFKVSFQNGFENKTFGEATQELTEMFKKMHSDILILMKSVDKVRVVLFHDELPYPVGYQFMDKSEFSSVNLEDTFFQVIQSYSTILIESGSGLRADVTIARLPSGGSNRQRVQYESEEHMIDSSNNIEKIVNQNNYCSIYAVLVAIGIFETKKDNFVNKQTNESTGKIPTRLFSQNELNDLSKQRNRILDTELKKFLASNNEFKGKAMIGLNVFPKLEKYFNYEYQITVVGFGEGLNNNQIENCQKHTIIYIGERHNMNQKSLYILHTKNHYDCIKSIKSFYRSHRSDKSFCDICKIPYYIGHHACISNCEFCQRQVCLKGEEKKCEFCSANCKSIDCNRIHTKRVCRKAKLCEFCKTTKHYRHVCFGQKYCNNCKIVVELDHKCFILTTTEKDSQSKIKKNQNKGYIFYDYECYEDNNNGGEHVVNLVKALKMCRACVFKKLNKYNESIICQERCHSEFETFWNNEDFCDWLFDKRHDGFTAVAHNFKGYDGILVLDYIKRKRTGDEPTPHILMNGTKIMTMFFRGVRFVDSLNFIQLPLEKFPETFGLKEMKKGFFPHKFNQPENWSYCGTLPDMKYYQPELFSCRKKAKFEEWYFENKDKEFIFKKEFEDYCESDVKLLMEGSLQFLDFIYGISKIEPMAEVITLASLTHAIFRKLNMIPSSIGIIPEKGYNAKEVYSKISMFWLKYLSHKFRINIQHRLNGGEKKILKYYVDGFCDENKTIYEFLGCFWHGCSNCYDANAFNNRLQKLYGTLYNQSLQRIKEIKDFMPEYKVVYIWECEFKKLIKNSSSLSEFVKNNEYIDPIDPRECMYGGRTNALKLYHRCEPGEVMRYLDFKSLYPFVQKYGIFPTGHPEIITENFKDITEYFGLVKCTILPPQNLYHPVLPFKLKNKLFFPLCYTCAMEMQNSCNHNEKQRALTGTWVTLEVEEALKEGYKILKIHEIWHYKESLQYDKDKKTGGR